LLVLPIAAAHVKHWTNPRTCRRIHGAGQMKVVAEKVHMKCGGDEED